MKLRTGVPDDVRRLRRRFGVGLTAARRLSFDALIPELGQLARLRPQREFLDSFIIRGPSCLELRRVG